MISTFINSFKVSFVEKANTFIYFLKRLPFIGKKIPDSLYKRTQAKLVIGIISMILGIFGGFLRKTLYLCLMVILPSYLITNNINKVEPVFIHIFFFLSLIVGPIMKSVIFDKNNKAAFNMITLMRADAREYYVGELLHRNVLDFIYFLMPMLIIGLIIGLSPLKVLILIVELVALRFIGEWLQLYMYDKKESQISEKKALMSIVIIGGLVLAYALPPFGFAIDFGRILFNGFAVIILLGISVAAFRYLWKYKRYTIIGKTLLTKDNLFDIEALKTQATFGNVKIDEKKMSSEDLNTKKYDDKHGYEYLNSLFFLRFRRIMVKPIRDRVVVIGILFLIAIISMLFIPNIKSGAVDAIKKSMPLLVFIMYSMSTGERICKAMFYNCDSSLLRYAYYRQGDVILSNFTSRLKRVVVLNLIPAFTLCVGIALVIVIIGFGSELIGMLPLFLCILCLSCFFSIHYLFLYYVIQPYTAELTVKSPLFKFINMAMYFACYMCLQLRTSSYYFTAGIIISTIVYMGVALVLTYRIAPRTFKLKI